MVKVVPQSVKKQIQKLIYYSKCTTLKVLHDRKKLPVFITTTARRGNCVVGNLCRISVSEFCM